MKKEAEAMKKWHTVELGQEERDHLRRLTMQGSAGCDSWKYLSEARWNENQTVFIQIGGLSDTRMLIIVRDLVPIAVSLLSRDR